MKLRIEIADDLAENEIVIRCREIDDEIQRLQRVISETASDRQQMLFYQEEKECYLSLQKILFFETSGNTLEAHTAEDVFTVKYRLYELERMLPSYFMRVSKSTILNVREVYSITKSLTASSLVEFQGTHKKVYVSRNYYKALKAMLDHVMCRSYLHES